MTSVAASAAAFGSVAFAQDTDVGEVVVTASRAAITGYTASTPTTVIGADTFQKKGLNNVADVVTQNPAFRADASPNGNGVKSAAPGQTAANLRGLGGQRTLVMVNGSRIVPLAPATSTGTPVTADLNVIPSILISRMEVVTGGASAQWGSDAVAGVVNVILNNTYEGLKITGQYGISDQNDGEKKSAGILAGTKFAGGKGHIVVAGEWQKFDGLGDYRTRDWAKAWGLYTAPAAYRAANPGTPGLVEAPNFYSSFATGGNTLPTAPAAIRNIQFLPNGQIAAWDPGAFTASQVQLGGGQGITSWVNIPLNSHFNRYSTYARAQYELTDWITASLEAGYSQVKGGQNGSTPRISLGVTPYTDPTTGRSTPTTQIQIDNAYLPAAMRTLMQANGITSFAMQRMSMDLGYSQNHVTNKTPHFAVGLEGKVNDDWSWDAHYTWGENKYSQVINNDIVTLRYNFAADAVVNPANGQIVCRATLQGNPLAAGCVPVNLFGDGTPSAAAKAYIMTTANTHSKYKQQTAAFNVKGKLVDLPAGPFSVAAGVEWRDESQNVTVDPLAQAAQYLAVGNATAFSGKFNTKEGYIDSIIPIVKDVPGIKSLDLTAAARISDYSTFGTAKTWKVGANWEIVDGLTVRVTDSKDFRAPAIYELFGGGQVITTTVSLRGVTYQIPQNFTLGNPDLGPERSKTFTAGVVLQPKFFPGFRASVDYFDIKINDAVSAPNNQQVANLCTQGNQAFCDFFTFNAAGAPTSLVVPAQNLASLEVKGYDIAANYTKDLSDMPGMPSNSRLDLSVQGTYTDHYINDTGLAPAQDLAGQDNDAGTPTWRLVFQQSLRLNKLRFTAEEYYISSGVLNPTYNTTSALSIASNHVPKYMNVNMYANYDITEKLQAFLGVDNVFDKAPPVIPSQDFPTPPAGGTFYDKMGRYYRVGLTYEF